MATGLSQANIDTALDAAVTGTLYVQLHVGDPGAAGTANVAGENARQAVTFAAAAGGTKASNADAKWSGVSTTETYTDFSLWSAAAGGTFEGSGAVANGAVAAGDDFTIPAGSLTVSISGAA